MYVGSNKIDWDVHLPAALYAYNVSVSETTGDTTFFLTYHYSGSISFSNSHCIRFSRYSQKKEY